MSLLHDEIKREFNNAVQHIRSSEKNDKIGDETKLKFYSLYKQATIGKCNTEQPWAINVVERAKWDSWNQLGNMKKETAMIKYLELYVKTK